MFKSISLKNILPHLVAVIAFALISVLYFIPQYEGKDVQQFDTVQANGMKGSILAHIEEYGEHPQWLANMFGGMPAYPIHMEAEGKFIPSMFGSLFFLGSPSAFYFVLMLGFYLMLLCFRVNPWLAIVGSIGYGLSSYFFIIYGAGHIMKLVALCYIAPMVGSFYLAYSRKLLLGASLFGIFASLEITSVHPQIFYYFIYALIAMAVAFLVKAIKDKEVIKFVKQSLVLLFFSLLAVGANAYYIYYTLDYAQDSTRGKSILTTSEGVVSDGLDKDYITAWSYGKIESFNMFIPNLMGGSSEGGMIQDGKLDEVLKSDYNLPTRERTKLIDQIPSYFGPQPMTSGPVYIGAVMIFLFVLSMFVVRGVNLWWISSVSLLALFLAWGHNMMWLTDIFIDNIPLYNKFRTVSMILVVVEFTAPLMAMLGLNKIIKGEVDPKRLRTAFMWSVCITGGVALFFWLFGGVIIPLEGGYDNRLGLPEDILAAVRDDRVTMMRSDALRSLLFVTLSAVVLYLSFKKKIGIRMFVALLSLLVLADMIPVNLRYLGWDKFVPKKEANTIQLREVDKLILNDTSNYRVADMSVSTFSDASASMFHRSIGGYFAAKPRRYQDLIDYHLSRNNEEVYNMLNTKYFIMPNDQNQLSVQLNMNALGNAWFVENVAVVDSPEREITMLNEISASQTAIVSDEFEKMLPAVYFPQEEGSYIKEVSYRDNRIVYESYSNKPELAIFSEMWYPKGWTAYIDGVKSDYLRANYVLNAMVIPAGQHTIIFEFEPPYYSILKTITIVSSIALLLSLIFAVYIDYKKRKNKNNE